MDVALDRVIAIAKDGNGEKEKKYMEISGLVSSYHEHDIFERIDGFASVSAVRALQVASANGIPIQHVTSQNISQILPLLQVNAEIKADIQNAINAGKEVPLIIGGHSHTNVTPPAPVVTVKSSSSTVEVLKPKGAGASRHPAAAACAAGRKDARVHRAPPWLGE